MGEIIGWRRMMELIAAIVLGSILVIIWFPPYFIGWLIKEDAWAISEREHLRGKDGPARSS